MCQLSTVAESAAILDIAAAQNSRVNSVGPLSVSTGVITDLTPPSVAEILRIVPTAAPTRNLTRCDPNALVQQTLADISADTLRHLPLLLSKWRTDWIPALTMAVFSTGALGAFASLLTPYVLMNESLAVLARGAFLGTTLGVCAFACRAIPGVLATRAKMIDRETIGSALRGAALELNEGRANSVWRQVLRGEIPIPLRYQGALRTELVKFVDLTNQSGKLLASCLLQDVHFLSDAGYAAVMNGVAARLTEATLSVEVKRAVLSEVEVQLENRDLSDKLAATSNFYRNLMQLAQDSQSLLNQAEIFSILTTIERHANLSCVRENAREIRLGMLEHPTLPKEPTASELIDGRELSVDHSG